MGSAFRVRDRDAILLQALANLAAGTVKQLPSGQAGIFGGLNSATSGDLVMWQTKDQFQLPKLSTVNLLDGGRAYWSVANGYVTYARAANSQDFYIGRVVGDALAGSTTVVINFNVPETDIYDYVLSRDPFQSLFVGTRAIGTLDLQDRGGALEFSLAATNEAEKVDALGSDGFATGAGAIVEGAVTVIADDSSTNAVFSVGIASGTNATALTNVANYLAIQLKNHDTHIYAISGTGSGTVTTAQTDTTVTYAVGTRFEFWFDLRNPAAVAIYVNGLRVLSSTTFNVNGSASAWKLLAHLVKASSTDTMDVQVEWLRARLQQLSP